MLDEAFSMPLTGRECNEEVWIEGRNKAFLTLAQVQTLPMNWRHISQWDLISAVLLLTMNDFNT